MHNGHVAALPCSRSRRSFQLQCWMWERCHWHGVLRVSCFGRTQQLEKKCPLSFKLSPVMRLEIWENNLPLQICMILHAHSSSATCLRKYADQTSLGSVRKLPQLLHFSPFRICSMLAACYRLADQGKRDVPIIGRSSFSYYSEVLWPQSLWCTPSRHIPERDLKSAENVSC